MTKQKLGFYLHWASYVVLVAAGLVAFRHPAIIALLIVGAGSFLFGRVLEKSV